MPTATDAEGNPVALLDTSTAIALVVEDHEAHWATLDAVRGRQLGLAGHAWFETYSVLTRLPPGLRGACREWDLWRGRLRRARRRGRAATPTAAHFWRRTRAVCLRGPGRGDRANPIAGASRPEWCSHTRSVGVAAYRINGIAQETQTSPCTGLQPFGTSELRDEASATFRRKRDTGGATEWDVCVWPCTERRIGSLLSSLDLHSNETSDWQSRLLVHCGRPRRCVDVRPMCSGWP